jgi:hypothetical protein
MVSTEVPNGMKGLIRSINQKVLWTALEITFEAISPAALLHRS